MALAHAIAEHLPYLRRYARALCGTQKSGDAYVRACLEAIVADTSVLDARLSPRVGLYRLFHKLWNSAHVEVPAAALKRDADGVERRLSELTPARRQALLLTAMEGFNISDAAHILSVDEEEVKQMVSQAVREISNQPSTKVLIIEDEPIISLDLQSIVREMGHTVAAIATTRDEAVRAARKTEPGLVLADIKLADGSSGIDAVRQILSEVEVPIVFITAYPERLLTGERPEPTFLVTKPFVPETVRVAVSQALLFA
ncbi:response regulator [Peristeroidobacter soli]|jgi:DNA-directed RNA polymerase specialized sigma24 family protein/CheY-like chemotaxis protein|uniref:response regulator n=1 Tax=Peristeroidobacter soli TaxID=2497877 RepID=UPI00101DDEB2|nr:response regulator [Peristeroidobacter soli]